MAIYSNTLDNLIEWTCRLALHDWKSGTVTGTPTTAQFIDSSRNETDDYFQNTVPPSRVHIRTTTDGAAPQGEEREITDWALSTTLGTVAPVFTVAPGAGDTYAILSEYSWEEIKSAINMAIEMVAEEALFWTVDETTTLVAATYEYSLPTSMLYVYRVTMADADGNYPSPIPPEQWRILRASTPKLHLTRTPDNLKMVDHYVGNLWAEDEIVASRTLRIEGLASQGKLTTDASVCAISPAFVIYQAGALLHQARVRRAGNDPDDHATQADICQKRADIERGKIVRVQLPPNTKRVKE